MPRDLLINQRLLTYGASDSIVLLLLRDAVNDKRLTVEQLMKLIDLSREKGVELDSDFAVAAANAITMLNAAGYDFSHQDLSNISIPGANLSYGIFEGTNFRNANLQGVDFTGTWLQNANMVEVHLDNADFGETLGLRLRNEQIFNIAYSHNGKHLAVDVGDHTVIYENASPQQNDFKEVRRVPGHLLNNESCPFSMDGKQILTIIGKRSMPKKEDDDEDKEDYEDHGYDYDDEEGSRGVVDDMNEGDEEIEVEEEKVSETGHKFDNEREEVSEKQGNNDDMSDVEVGGENDEPMKSDPQDKSEEPERERSKFEEEAGKENPPSEHEEQYLSFCFWDVTSGNCLERIDVPLGNKRLLSFNPRRREVIAVSDSKVKKSSTTTDSWSEFPIPKGDDATSCELSMKDCDILLMRSYEERVRLCSVITGKSILQFKQRAASFKFSTDEKQIGLRTSYFLFMVDTVRGYPIKSLAPEQWYDSFRLIGQRFLATVGDGLILQDVSDAQTSLKLPLEYKSKDQIYKISLDHSANQIVYFENTDVVEFAKLPTNTVWPAPMTAIRGTNNKGLALQGVIVSSCDKLSEKNIMKFQMKGDYGVFPETILNKLFPSNSEESKAITEVTAINEGLAPIHAQIIGSNMYWSNLRKLDLSSNKIGDIGAIEIGRSKIWVNLEILNLSKNDIGDEGARTIGENNTWEKLVKLDLSSNKINQKQTIFSLSSKGSWENLKYLFLSDNQAVLEATDALKAIEGVASKSLEEIDLQGASFERALLQCLKYIESESVIELPLSNKRYNALHAEIIGLNTTWINLQTLNLELNSIGAEGATALSKNTTWINLQTLNLEYNSVDAEGATALSHNTTWTNLKALYLDHNKIGAEGATALSHNTTWTNLKALYLECNWIGNEGATALSHNTTWINLQTLNLQSNSIGDKGVIALSKNTTWTHLQTLDLSDNKIGAEGAIALSKNTTWINLQTLNLTENFIGSEGATALSKNTTWINLQTLELAFNSIHAEGATALSKNTTWINLQTLGLRYNWIDDKGATALSKNTTWINLQTLNLGRNSIHAEGATALSHNTTWINLQTLNLESNWIGAEGATALSKNTTWTHLQTLDLSDNNIGSEGATALSKNTTWINLQTLYLRRNSIHAEGATALSKNTTWINLQTLDLKNNSIDDVEAASLKKNQAWPQNIRISYYNY